MKDLEKEFDELKKKAGDDFDSWMYRDDRNKYYKSKSNLEDQMYLAQRKLALNSQALRNVVEYIKACDSAVARISAELDRLDK